MPTAEAKSRYTRIKPIVEFVAGQSSFHLEWVKEHCCQEQPGFVTRIIKDLWREGWLLEEDQNQAQFRWNSAKGNFVAEKWLDQKIFGTQIKESPEKARPREKLLDEGAEKLTNGELLAILIRSGRPGESAVMAGEKLARKFDGRLEWLPSAGRAELKEISSAIEKTAFCQIMAGVELGRRVAALSDEKITRKIRSSGDAIKFCVSHFDRLALDRKQEEFHIVTLDTKNQVVDTHQISVGTLDSSLVHPREVFRPAIKDAAASIILVHNHPSGDPTPSNEDIAVTERLTACGKTLGIDVLDHIVLAGKTGLSIRETA